MPEAKWISCEERMPPDGTLVIVEYEGMWPDRGRGGITDRYTWDGEWFNVPKTVRITHWMPIPPKP